MKRFNRYTMQEGDDLARKLMDWLLDVAPKLNLLLLTVDVSGVQGKSHSVVRDKLKAAIKDKVREVTHQPDDFSRLGDFMWFQDGDSAQALSVTFGEPAPERFEFQARRFMAQMLDSKSGRKRFTDVTLLRLCFLVYALGDDLGRCQGVKGYGLLNMTRNKFLFRRHGMEASKKFLSFRILKHPHLDNSFLFRIYQPKRWIPSDKDPLLFRSEKEGLSIFDFNETNQSVDFERIHYVSFVKANDTLKNNNKKMERMMDTIMASRVANEVYWQKQFESFLEEVGIEHDQPPFEPDLFVNALQKHRLDSRTKSWIDKNLMGLPVSSLCQDGFLEVRYQVDVEECSDDMARSEELAQEFERAIEAFNDKTDIPFKAIRLSSDAGLNEVDLYINDYDKDREGKGVEWVCAHNPQQDVDAFGRHKIACLKKGVIPSIQGVNLKKIRGKQSQEVDGNLLKRVLVELILKKWMSQTLPVKRDIDVDVHLESSTQVVGLGLQKFKTKTSNDKTNGKCFNLIGSVFGMDIQEGEMALCEVRPFFAPRVVFRERTQKFGELIGQMESQANNPKLMNSPLLHYLFEWHENELSEHVKALNNYAAKDDALILFEHKNGHLIRVWAFEPGDESLSPALKSHVDLQKSYPQMCKEWMLDDRFSRTKGKGSRSLVNESICGRNDPEYEVMFEGSRVFVNRTLNGPNKNTDRVLMSVFCLLYDKNQAGNELVTSKDNAGVVLAGLTSDEIGKSDFSGVKQSVYKKIVNLATKD